MPSTAVKPRSMSSMEKSASSWSEGRGIFRRNRTMQLAKGESLRVDASGQVIRLSHREWAAAQGLLPKTTLGRLPSYLDLADVVAGGNGRGTHRGGIDPRSGQFVTTHPAENDYASDGQYHRVQDNRGIDGVFIPDTTKGPVQLDSVGHLFDGFGTTNGRSWNFIWGGGVLPAVIWPNSTVLDIDYAADGHSLIGFHANKGITFDLEAMSAQLDGLEVARFITQIGNPSRPAGSANTTASGDIWIFVDGQLRRANDRSTRAITTSRCPCTDKSLSHDRLYRRRRYERRGPLHPGRSADSPAASDQGNT